MRLLIIICLICVKAIMQAQPSIELFADGINHWNSEHPDKNYKRYSVTDYEKIADNLLEYQNHDGGWPKNIDWLAVLNVDSVRSTLKKIHLKSTVDNRNIYSQCRYLAEVYTLSQKEKYRIGCNKALHYLLSTQKDNGGWRGWDVDAITFNDDVTIGILELFRDIIQNDMSFLWIDKNMRKRISKAYDKGVNIILKTQYVQNGVKTVWGQQHDNKTLLPTKARSYELPALTAQESVGIVEFLMSIDNPSREIIQAVDDAIKWFDSVKIEGIRIERVPLSTNEIVNHKPYDLVVVNDSAASPIWSRFYELSDNTPFMCNRSGEKVWKLSDVSPERRTGYGWYGYWPKNVLKKYEEWRKQFKCCY